MLGSFLLGQRLLYKQKNKFVSVTSSNGIIANTSVSIMLYVSSLMNYTISGTYILVPTLILLRKKDQHKKINTLKALKAVIGAVFITLLSMFLSVTMSFFLLWLDYKGPYSAINDVFH